MRETALAARLRSTYAWDMAKKTRVKFISKNTVRAFQLLDLPQFHADKIEWVLDADARDYDWFVVYDDLPPKGAERLTLGVEELACPQENTILLTYEPSSVKFYGQDYADQYGMVLTSHETETLAHRNRGHMPPVGFWFYGAVEQMQAHPSPPEKTGEISVFGSPKAQKHTLHHRRAEFLTAMAEGLGDKIDVFGKGYKFVEHKAEGIDNYRYHIAVENHIGPHHWTEKLSDSYLGYALPLYVGCANVEDYFPEDSFIRLDIADIGGAIERIEKAVADKEYEKRLPAIIEARRRVIEDYNLGNIVAKHILQGDTVRVPHAAGKILSRHAMQRRDIMTFLRYAVGKTRARRRGRMHYADYLAGKIG